MLSREHGQYFIVTAIRLAIAAGLLVAADGRLLACSTCESDGFCEVCSEPHSMLHGGYDWNNLAPLGLDPEGLLKIALVNTDANTTKLTLNNSHANNLLEPVVVCFTTDPNNPSVRVAEDQTIPAIVMLDEASKPCLVGANGGIGTGSFTYYSPEGLLAWSWDDANSVFTRGIDSIFQTTMTANYDYSPGDEEHVTYQEVRRGTRVLSRTYFKYTRDVGGKLVRLRKTVQPYNLTSMYVYYGSSCQDANNIGKLRLQLGPEQVNRFLAAAGYSRGVDANSPTNACDLDDLETTPDDPNGSLPGLSTYAATEYTSYDSQGRITSMKNEGCSSCGGAAEAGSYSFVYGESDSYDGNSLQGKLSTCKSFRGAKTPNGMREVNFVNGYNQIIFHVDQQMDGNSIEKIWITHYTYYCEGTNKIGKIYEKRMPSACEGAQYGHSESDGWVTAIAPNNCGTSGLVYVYDYDTSSGKIASEKLRQGTDGNQPAYWVRRCTYGSSTATLSGTQVTVYNLACERTYPQQTTDANDSTALDTVYSYDYHAGTNAVAFKTVTYPKVTYGKNGSDANTSVSYHYFRDANSGVLLYYNDWVRHEDGHYSYTELGKDYWNWGQVVRAIEDVKTGPGGMTQPSHEGWEAKTDGLNLTTTYAYYSDGVSYSRPKSTALASGRTIAYAYVHQEQTAGTPVKTTTTRLVTLTTPHMDANDPNHYDYAPMQIAVEDLAGRTAIAAQGYPNTGQDGNMINDWNPAQADIASAFDGTIISKRVDTYDDNGHMATSDSYYDLSGEGKYLRTIFSYSQATGRRYMTTETDGTMTWIGVDGLGREISVYKGTGDTDANENDPGTLKQVSATEYDGGGVGDGKATRRRQFYLDANSYDTVYQHDWQGHLIASRGSDGIVTKNFPDNFGRTVKTVMFADSVTANFQPDEGEPFLGVSTTDYDQRGRLWRSRDYKMGQNGVFDPNALATSVSLTFLYWHDARGRLVKTSNPNSLSCKQTYDGAGRPQASYVCYDPDEPTTMETYAEAASVDDDIVIEQTSHSYDANGNQWLTRYYRRYETDATNTGELNDPNGSDPKAVVTYTARWFDCLGRAERIAYYGTNGNTPITEDDYETPPDPNTSADYLVARNLYDPATGMLTATVDNKNRQTRRVYDALGRMTSAVENYVDGTPAGSDQSRTTNYRYDFWGRLARLTAKNPGAADQNTYYFFWDTVTADGNQNLPSGSLVTAVAYPDSEDSVSDELDQTSRSCRLTETVKHDHVSYGYDLLGRKTTMTDQRKVGHAYSHSSTNGRLESDTASFPATVPASLDTTIRRIGYGYDVLGRVSSIRSYDANGVANEIALTRDSSGWGAVTKSVQAHTGEAVSGDPSVQYYYEDASKTGGFGPMDYEANYIRLYKISYPGPSTKRLVYYNYSTSGVGGRMSRLMDIAPGTAAFPRRPAYAAYTYLGTQTMIKVEYSSVATSIGGLALTYGTSGDGYSGLDRFGRVRDQKWLIQTPGTVRDRFTYGYDYAGNRLYRANGLDPNFSELYHANGGAYDGLDRLLEWRRGRLNDDRDQVADVDTTRRRAYCLDALGNLNQYQAADSGASFSLIQARIHNAANEIWASDGNSISGTWIDPEYDPAGNMIKGPKPGDESTAASTQWYAYDAWNRLTTVSQGTSSPGTPVAGYCYDGLGQRIRKIVVGDPDTVYDYYRNEASQVIEVRKESSANPFKQYAWGAEYPDAPIVRFRDQNTDGTVDDTLHFLHDAHFNTTALVDPNGAVVERYAYDPYGRATVLNGACDQDTGVSEWTVDSGAGDWDNEILYCGYPLDWESGLYYVRHRYLTPALDRWMTRDPIVYGDSMNLYQYVKSNPAAYQDPKGLEVSVGGPINMDFELLKKIGDAKDGTWQTQKMALPSDSLEIYKFSDSSGGTGQSVEGAIEADWASKEGWTGAVGVKNWYRLNARPSGKLRFESSKESQQPMCVKGTVTVQIGDFHLWSTDPDAEYGKDEFREFVKEQPVALDKNEKWQFKATWWKPFDKVTITMTGRIDTCGESKDLQELDSGSWDFTPKAISLRQATVSSRRKTPGFFGHYYWNVNAQDVGVAFDQSNLKATVYCKKGGEN